MFGGAVNRSDNDNSVLSITVTNQKMTKTLLCMLVNQTDNDNTMLRRVVNRSDNDNAVLGRAINRSDSDIYCGSARRLTNQILIILCPVDAVKRSVNDNNVLDMAVK